MEYRILIKAIATDGLISKSKDRVYFIFTYGLYAMAFEGFILVDAVFGMN
jgi:hypothetical protein